MPTYEYLCQDCEQPLEVFQSFADEALTVCPNCNGSLRKVFGSVGVVFKGSGFYRTDSRDSKSAATLPAAKKADVSTAAPAAAAAPATSASSPSAAPTSAS
ncbi:MAG: FmdB family zinc ribbon protein [Candidatus Nanopelagicales bacterium]